jgi:hypothetical protein
MVMQGAALVAQIGSAVFMLPLSVVGMMAMLVRDAAGLLQVGSNVLFTRVGMLQVDTDQRQHACGLGQEKKSQQPWAEAPKVS